MDKERKSLIENYFKITDIQHPNLTKIAKFGISFLIWGGLLLYFETLGVFKNVSLVGSILIVLGVVSFFLWLRPFISFKKIFYSRPYEADIDIWFIDDMHAEIKPRALELLQINERSLKDENIIFIPYPIYWNEKNIKGEVIRRGDHDGRFRYTMWVVQVLVVTEKYVSYYSCNYDWRENRIFKEYTNEYFFDDISSVRNDVEDLPYSMLSEDEEEGKESALLSAEVFKIKNMSGDSITVVTEVPDLNVPDLYVNNLKKLVIAMRVLLRNRRYGETIEVREEGATEIELPVEDDEVVETSGVAIFHQQLRELYDEYCEAMDAKRKSKGRE